MDGGWEAAGGCFLANLTRFDAAMAEAREGESGRLDGEGEEGEKREGGRRGRGKSDQSWRGTVRDADAVNGRASTVLSTARASVPKRVRTGRSAVEVSDVGVVVHEIRCLAVCSPVGVSEAA